MAIEWVVPVVGAVGFVAWRSWRQDAAWKSGELMDLRDLLPSGEGDVEVRVLANRRYRVELQIEGVLREPLGKATAGAPVFPFELVVSRTNDALGAANEAPVHQMAGALERRLRVMGPKSATEQSGDGRVRTTRFAGSVPLLELVCDELVRLRFEVTVAPGEGSRGEGSALDKAFLLVKEDVGALRGRGLEIDRVALALANRLL